MTWKYVFVSGVVIRPIHGRSVTCTSAFCENENQLDCHDVFACLRAVIGREKAAQSGTRTISIAFQPLTLLLAIQGGSPRGTWCYRSVLYVPTVISITEASEESLLAYLTVTSARVHTSSCSHNFGIQQLATFMNLRETDSFSLLYKTTGTLKTCFASSPWV